MIVAFMSCWEGAEPEPEPKRAIVGVLGVGRVVVVVAGKRC